MKYVACHRYLIALTCAFAAFPTLLWGACPTGLSVSVNWYDLATGVKSGYPYPSAGRQIRFTIVVTNPTGADALNLTLIDTLPTDVAKVTATAAPGGWTPDLTQSGTGGRLLAQFSGGSVAIGQSATFFIDMLFTGAPCSLLNPSFVMCSGVAASAGEAGAYICSSPLGVTIYTSGGLAVRTYGPYYVASIPTRVDITYTASGACATATVNNTQPLSPNNDCHNDILKFVFPDILGPSGQAFDSIWWDGRDGTGSLVADGQYLAKIETVDASTGSPTIFMKALDVCQGCTVDGSSATSSGEAKQGEVKIIGGIRGYVDPKQGQMATIQVSTSGPGEIAIKIYSQQGTLVRELRQDARGKGKQVLHWDGNDSSGKPVKPGIYLAHIKGPGVNTSEKLAVVR